MESKDKKTVLSFRCLNCGKEFSKEFERVVTLEQKGVAGNPYCTVRSGGLKRLVQCPECFNYRVSFVAEKK